MNKTLSALVAGTLLMVGVTPAVAAASDAADATGPAQGTLSLMGRKLGRGLVNASTGWSEFPKAMYLTSEEWGPVFGAVFGSFQGLEVSAVRTLAGFYEAATFPVPLPAQYVPVVLPASAFTWGGLYLRSPR